MRLLLIILLSFSFFYFPQIVNAQTQSKKTILVLDAPGSMWGQIDGVSKIEIARSVIGDLLKDFPAEHPLGLTA